MKSWDGNLCPPDRHARMEISQQRCHNHEFAERCSRSMTGINTAAEIFADPFFNLPCDHDLIPQERLDLASKLRSSLLPWRGQFSPELVELLLRAFTNRNDIV